MMTGVTPSLPVTKRDRIVYLLDHWDEIFDPNVTSPLGSPSSGGVQLMPLMSRHPSVVELARCLVVLRRVAPRQHDHLKAYYLAEWRIRTDVVRKKRRGGKFETTELRRRERVVPRWVRLEKVRRGEGVLVEAFSGEVFIPSELWDALTRPAAA